MLAEHFSSRQRFPGITSRAPHYIDQVITDAHDVTAEWLTAVLSRELSDDKAVVSDVLPILSRKIHVSTVHRLAVKYQVEHQLDTRSRTLFLKLCRHQEEGHPPGICESEVDFYTTVAPEMTAPPLVRVFDAAYDPTSGRSHLLMEDLTETHWQQEQETTPSIEMSRLAIEAMAQVHARWWSNPRLGNGVGLVFDNEWLEKFVADLDASVSEFIGSCSGELTAEQTEALQLMLDAAPQIWGRLTNAHGLTVTHGDAHWWNFLYPIDPAQDSVRIFDWQLWHIDLGARDLAFLLAMGGFAEPRPELDDELLDQYHSTLIQYGVTGYSREMLDEDYRWSALRNLNLPVIFRRQGKHETTWKTALERSFAAFKRLECEALIG